MKIGIDAREFQAGRMTGIGRYLGHFLQSASTSSFPHECVLFCNQKTHLPFDHSKLKRVIIPEKITLVWDQLSLPRNIAREKIDVLLTPYFKAPLFPPSNMVLIINDLMPLFFPEENSLFKRIYFRIMCRAAGKRAKRIITISANTRDDAVKLLKLPADKIRVVHLGVEEKFRSADVNPEEIRGKYSLPQKFILYVGNLNPHKNVQGLINSFAAVPASLRKQYKLILVANQRSKYLSSIKIHIRKMGLAQNVLISAFIEEKDLIEVYRLSTLFVFPSFYEGFGLPPLEAMAFGCPVVSSDTSSMPEVLGDAALYFNPYSMEEMSAAIRKILEDENLRDRFRLKGLSRVKLFSIEKMTNEIIDVLESAVE